MLKSLAAVIGLSFIGLGALFLLSADKTVSYDSLARSRLVVPFPKEKILIYGATTYFGSPLFDEELISRRCSEETAVRDFLYWETPFRTGKCKKKIRKKQKNESKNQKIMVPNPFSQ